MFVTNDVITIDTPVIRLDALLKLAGVCETGGQAKLYIQSGHVRINGAVCPLRGKKCVPGDRISFDNDEATLTVAAE